MKLRITEENTEAENLIPPTALDGSGIGVNYADVHIKAMNVELEDGRKVTCKRKGLKVLLTVGDRKGEALMRRIEHGPDVKCILRQALEAAATEAGTKLTVEDGVIYLEEIGDG